MFACLLPLCCKRSVKPNCARGNLQSRRDIRLLNFLPETSKLITFPQSRLQLKFVLPIGAQRLDVDVDGKLITSLEDHSLDRKKERKKETNTAERSLVCLFDCVRMFSFFFASLPLCVCRVCVVFALVALLCKSYISFVVHRCVLSPSSQYILRLNDILIKRDDI